MDKKLITKTFDNEALMYRYVSDYGILKENIQFLGKSFLLYQLSYWSY